MSHSIFDNNNFSLNNLYSISGMGIWVFDLSSNFIQYNDEYLNMLGYTQNDVNGSIKEWKAMYHPKDLTRAMKMLANYLAGKSESFTYELRIRNCSGDYIWVRNTAHITARNANGVPTQLVGTHLNINEVKQSQKKLAQALKSLKYNHISMEQAAEKHSMEMLEQGKLLWTVNQISRKLLAISSNEDFESIVKDCLSLLGESIEKNRVYIWKDCIDSAGRSCCTLIYEWVHGVDPVCDKVRFWKIPYEELPCIQSVINEDKCLNSLMRTLSDSEKRILTPQGIKTILIAPISINGNRWGFIGVDNCENEQLFSIVEENMLLMSGSLLASAIEKRVTDAALREMEERTQIMLNATPLCCNLWTQDFQNMSCNDEAVRLFELTSQQEYLDRFFELSPEFQPCGKPSNEQAAEYILKAFEEGYCRFEWLHQKIDGTPIPAEITLVRIKHKGGFIVAGYTRDLREQKAMLEELKTKDALRRARDQALSNSKAKSNFLANMSHEIRTPMNAISGFAEIILRESTSKKTTEYANGIKSACGSLISIINDILDITKIESGKLEIYNNQYELASLLNDAITISRMKLGSKPLMFITDIDSLLPARLIGDEIRMKQILLNILSNAIKYTQEGYIALRVFSTLEGNQATIHISVKDSGVGIKPEDLEQLFDEFERVNTTKNRNIEGTGLGLAISKQLCEMMGGHIKVESTFGVGSDFIVCIPQECPSYERIAQVKEEKSVLLYEPRERYRFSIAETLENLDCKCISCANQSELYNNIRIIPFDYVLTAALHIKKVKSTLQKYNLSVPVAAFADYGETVSEDTIGTILFPVNCLQLANLLNGHHTAGNFTGHSTADINFTAKSARVLVVDDNLVNLQVAKGLMEPYQFTIDTALNGLEAIKMVQHTEYDLVFMDHMMPEMDGVDATAAIRSLHGDYYQNLPIIALTANALVGTREMFIREGMNDFLAKPIEINKLAHLLIKWLPPTKVIKSMPSEIVKADEIVKAKEIVSDWNIAGVNTVQGIMSVGGSKENYLQILSAYHTDGMEKCSSLLQHITRNDIAAFRTEIHALKSTSATIGAIEISSLAANLETAAQSCDHTYIDHNIKYFLTSLQSVLDSIRLLIPNSQPASTDSRTYGNDAELIEILNSLQTAAEFVNISQIEEELKKLLEFIWNEDITKEVHSIQRYLSVFDYDAILECVIRLKESIVTL